MKTIKTLGRVYKKYHYLIIGDVGINEKDNMYIDGLHYDPTTDTMIGTEYMLCRQIIREHDEHSPRRGCRIYVKNNDDGGSQFVFTLPVAN